MNVTILYKEDNGKVVKRYWGDGQANWDIEDGLKIVKTEMDRVEFDELLESMMEKIESIDADRADVVSYIKYNESKEQFSFFVNT